MLVLFKSPSCTLATISNILFFLYCLYNIRTQTDCLHCPYINKKASPDHSNECIAETVHPDPECGYSGCLYLLSVFDPDCLIYTTGYK